jgi:hypothetical protein
LIWKIEGRQEEEYGKIRVSLRLGMKFVMRGATFNWLRIVSIEGY